MGPYRHDPRSEPEILGARRRRVSNRDIIGTWQVLVVLALVRLAIAFARGEPPFGTFPIGEPGFAFLVLIVALPRAARGLRRAPAEERQTRGVRS